METASLFAQSETNSEKFWMKIYGNYFRGCENGVCIAPETCQCQPKGWALDSSGYKCVPKCDRQCLNGVCSG